MMKRKNEAISGDEEVLGNAESKESRLLAEKAELERRVGELKREKEDLEVKFAKTQVK
jgi:predicted RNase H-like nuclease (RuvC/YqgF family)